MPRKRWRWKPVDEFIKEIPECGETRLIVGIDPEPPDPYPNAIFYVRMVSQDMDKTNLARLRRFGLASAK